MKRKIKLVVVIILVALTSLLIRGNFDKKSTSKNFLKQKIILRYAEVNPEEDEITKAANFFSDEVRKKTKEEVIIQVYPDAKLGSRSKVMNDIRMGTVDITKTSLESFDDEYLNVFALPYLFRDEQHAWDVLKSQIGERIKQRIAIKERMLVPLGFLVSSERGFFFNGKDVKKLEDMKGLRIRVVPNDKIYNEMIKSLGAEPVPIKYSEVYRALKMKIIDGAENPLKNYSSNKFYEVAPNYVFTGHIIQIYVILISRLSWENLSYTEKIAVKEAVKETEIYFQEIMNENEVKEKLKLKGQKINFYKIDDKYKWKKAVNPLYKKYREKYSKLIKNISEIR